MGHCTWTNMNAANKIYHDTEWGIPVHDDRQMFEHLTLECMQCGLSWDLMLKKREIFRRCFDNFDYDKVASYDDSDVERIMNTEGMIRSPRKVRAVINNAWCYQKVLAAREHVEWRREYMTLLERDERMREEGREEVRKEAEKKVLEAEEKTAKAEEKALEAEKEIAMTEEIVIRAIRDTMNSDMISATEAMDKMSIPAELREKYSTRLK